MPERPAETPDINPARLATDPLLAEIAAMVAYMDLHVGRYEIRQMDTRQKELWADLVDADAIRAAHEDDAGSDDAPRRSVRWWRDYRRPIGEEGHAHDEQVVCRGCGRVVTWDADTERFFIPYGTGNPPPETFHCVRGPLGRPHWALPSGADEPDPFLYADEGGDRVAGADQPVHTDAGAVNLARAALLDVADHTHPYWWSRDEDFTAVYEWAKQAVRPMRKTTGEAVGQIGTMRTYPSLNDARVFLDAYRATRMDRRG